MRTRSALLVLLQLLAAFGIPLTARAADADSPKTLKRSQKDILAANIDPKANPGHDFFLYANGRWFVKNPIPRSEASWGIGNLVNLELYKKKLKINREAAKTGGVEGSETRKIGDFWKTAMDSSKADREGAKPLASLLRNIDGIATSGDAVRIAFELNRYGADVFWSFDVQQDQKNSDVLAVQLAQGGLGLPDRDYYTNAEAGVLKARTEYPLHVARMLKLLGQDEKAATRAGVAILQFETALAKASRTLDQLRDPNANYNKMRVAELKEKHTPSIDWAPLLSKYGLVAAETAIVGQPEFFSALDTLLKETPVDDLKNYLRFHLVSSYAPFLGKKFDNENFAFYGRILAGQLEQRPRWKRVLDAEESAMGMVLGRIFVKEYFPEHTKKRYNDLVEAIRDAYRERIQRLEWMSEPTKQKALEKLRRMTKKVGYPDKWKDYSTLKITTESFAANMMSAHVWHFDDRISKYGKPVDRSEWTMTPQTYNAYYNPSNNEIVLPAGIFLIAGLRDDDADDALIYGYAGASTIGHEITHGFDDEGRQFDVEGNLANWWTKEDEEKFNKRAEVMVHQFEAYEPLPGIHINGKATLGENIADFGGVLLGLEAFKKTEGYRRGEKIAGLSPVQRYFLGYTLGWLHHQREEDLRRRLLSDVHAPPKWRVLGPFANAPEFYEAFGVKEGDPMWRPDTARVKIW